MIAATLIAWRRIMESCQVWGDRLPSHQVAAEKEVVGNHVKLKCRFLDLLPGSGARKRTEL
jgi:hypothetical protein